jgi:hypothetical protein
LVLARDVVKEFKNLNSIDIVNVIFLTDGENTEDFRTTQMGYNSNKLVSSYISDSSRTILRDLSTGKIYSISARTSAPYRARRMERAYHQIRHEVKKTDTLVKMLKDSTGANLVCFYLSSGHKRDIQRFFATTNQPSNGMDSFKKNGFYIVQNSSFDEYYLIPGGSGLTVAPVSFDKIEGSTSRQIGKQFSKMFSKQLMSRVILSKFVDRISKKYEVKHA